MKKTILKSTKETAEFANYIFQEIKPFLKNQAVVLELKGELGAGKTFFAQQLGKLFGVNEPVVSPTFVICRDYKIETGMLYHIDAYRLENSEEMEVFDWGEMMKRGNLIIIEWAEKVHEFLCKYYDNVYVLRLDFEHVDEHRRYVTVS